MRDQPWTLRSSPGAPNIVHRRCRARWNAPIGLLFRRRTCTRVDGGGGPSMLTGAPAVSYTIPRVGGGSDGLAAHHGSIVLMNFWATWCPPCQEEMPALEALYRSDRARGLIVLGIDQGESASDRGRVREGARRDVSDPRRRGSAIRVELRVGRLADDGGRRARRSRGPRASTARRHSQQFQTLVGPLLAAK